MKKNILIFTLLFLPFLAHADHALSLPPNRLGQVMVMMYHRIGDPEVIYVRTVEHFRQDLETFYEKGYYLINLVDLVEGHIHVPLGKTPLVLTFDDAAPGQFNKINGDWDPNCAVGMIKAMHDKHPDFGMAATFYLNADANRSTVWSAMLQEMVGMGFELGNHTLTHPNLDKISDQEVIFEIGELQAWVKENVPGYQLRTMAMPYGLYPLNLSLALSGNYNGTSYHNEALLEAGANPSLSPFDPKFDPLHIPRIVGNDPDLSNWLQYFDEHPEARYIGDGN